MTPLLPDFSRLPHEITSVILTAWIRESHILNLRATFPFHFGITNVAAEILNPKYASSMTDFIGSEVRGDLMAVLTSAPMWEK